MHSNSLNNLEKLCTFGRMRKMYKDDDDDDALIAVNVSKRERERLRD